VLGADVARQLLRAELLEEVRIHLVPLLLGGGTPLFDGEQAELIPEGKPVTGTVTHLRFRVATAQSAIASATDLGARTWANWMLPAGIIQVMTSTAKRPVRTAGSASACFRAVAASTDHMENPRKRSSSCSVSGPRARISPRSCRSAPCARCRS
jgi:hypothetical protein